jgi:hypothetical protein
MHVNKDTKRFDTPVMNVQKEEQKNLVSKYTLAIL